MRSTAGPPLVEKSIRSGFGLRGSNARTPQSGATSLAVTAAISAAVLVAAGTDGDILLWMLGGIALAIAAYCLWMFPAWVLGGYASAAIMFDANSASSMGFASPVFDPKVAMGIALVLALRAAADIPRIRLARLPLLPLWLLAASVLMAATFFGAVNGVAGGGSRGTVIDEAAGLVVVLALVPAAIVITGASVMRSSVLVWFVSLVVLKAGLSLVFWAAGRGTSVQGSGLLATSLEAGNNWLYVLVILGVVAAALTGRVGWTTASWVSLLPFLALVFSYRRSFAIALVLGLAVLSVLMTPRDSWKRGVVVVTMALAAVGAVSLLMRPEGVQSTPSQLGSRISKVAGDRSTGDRYRGTERANVLAEIRSHPIDGLGLAVEWKQTEPLSAYLPTGRLYTHVAVLWFWMKLGILGAAAYALLMIATLATGLFVLRRGARSVEPWVGAVLAASIVALVFADTTASFTGVDPRLSIVFALVVGTLVGQASRGEATLSRGSRAPLEAKPNFYT